MTLDSPAGSPPERLEAPGGAVMPDEPSEFAGGSAGYPDKGTIRIAYCHSTQVSHSWHTSLMTAIAYDKSVGPGCIGGAPIQVYCSGPHGLVEGRNLAISMFLDQAEDDWLMWIDTDMGFSHDAIEQLWLAADVDSRPVIGGLCFAAKMQGPDGKGGYVIRPLPTLFGLAKDKDGRIGFLNRATYPPDTLYQTAGTGAAFILIHRSVLQTMFDKYGDDWYTPVAYDNKKPISEDLSFCWRLGDLGIPLFVHTGVRITHHKEIWLGEDQYDMPDEDPIFKQIKPRMEIKR